MLLGFRQLGLDSVEEEEVVRILIHVFFLALETLGGLQCRVECTEISGLKGTFIVCQRSVKLRMRSQYYE